jgi:integrase
MAKHILNRLSARKVASALKPGRYVDGGGLHLVVGAGGSRKWVFRFAAGGKQHDMGLGAVRDVSLPEARQFAAAARGHVRAGRDPIAAREELRRTSQEMPTFGTIADALIDGIEHGFRSGKHRAQWRMTLRKYAAPLRSKPVDQITTADVLGVLQPLWQSKPETASRLRGRIERVLDAARAKGHRTGENPARWRGHLNALLPKRPKHTRGHHTAMPFADVPDFATKLRGDANVGARALEFLILTAARSGEVLGARRSEIDLNERIWTVPASRTKAGRVHRVPLSDRTSEIVLDLLAMHSGDHVFPGARVSKPLSSMALAMTLRRMGIAFTVHGFRSAFRDWAGERTHFSRELAEAALAHVVGDETERAYRRGDALERRRELMDAWALFCAPKAPNVVPIMRARS